MRNVFLASHKVAGKHVLLVDDIVTTGATLCAAQEALAIMGVLSIKAWVVLL